MAIRKTDALILKTLPFRSTSLIVTFFTKDFGKVKGLVKGVRQEGEERGALYELFMKLEILYYEKLRSDLHLVSEAFMLESYDPLRRKMETIATASYFADLADQLTELYDPNETIFELLDFSFRYLPSLACERLARIFETHLLKEIGWLPFLDSCMKCRKRGFSKGLFSPIQGTLLCETCAPQFSDARPISEETLAALRYYAAHDLDSCVKYPVGSKSQKGLAVLMERFFRARLHKPLKSLLFLERIKPAFHS